MRSMVYRLGLACCSWRFVLRFATAFDFLFAHAEVGLRYCMYDWPSHPAHRAHCACLPRAAPASCRRNKHTKTTRKNRYEFALVLNPNDEYRDAVEVLELALDLGEREGPAAGGAAGAAGGKTTSPQKLDKARRVRESLGGLQHQHQHPSTDSRETLVR